MIATATPGFWDWSLDPPLVLVIDLAFLYWLGSRRTVTPERTRSAQRLRAACFYACMLTLAVALASPIEILSEQLFWVHMVQHVLLLMVAAPLLVLSRPWIRLWRCLPLGSRRSLARSLSRRRRPVAAGAPERVPRQARAELRALLRRTARLASAVHVRRDPHLGHPARAGAHAVLRHGRDVLEAGDPVGAAARGARARPSGSCT